jgi:hypothetical protein
MFSEISILTMIHGIGLSGGALLGMAAVLFYLMAVRPADAAAVTSRQSRWLATVAALTAVSLWLAVIVGTYVIFPQYRVPPPEGVIDLAAYPRALIMADPENRWLHAFAMETKEHLPWIAAMLATAAAAVLVHQRARLLADGALRRASIGLLAASIVIVSYVALLGVFVNKFAPLE